MACKEQNEEKGIMKTSEGKERKGNGQERNKLREREGGIERKKKNVGN